MSARARLVEERFDPGELLTEFSRELEGEGAIVSFSGHARGLGAEGHEVEALVLDAYRGMTLASLETISGSAIQRFAITRCYVVHRHGSIAPGEAIVFVATAARHRADAFSAAQYLMDRLKTEAVLWKREQGGQGTRWIEPSDTDRAARARWDDVAPQLSHLDEAGRARMVDVGDKPVTARRAVARGALTCAPGTLARVREGRTPKGGVIGTAELAGVMAAKRTAELIPLCHPLPLSKVLVEIALDDAMPGFTITAEVRSEGRTGVEMEALTAVSVACLTLFDMLKAVDKGMTIGAIRVAEKSGGRSGDWQPA